jgi:hypothetical protein
VQRLTSPGAAILLVSLDPADFHPLLQRDLDTFFRSKLDSPQLRVEYELLRQGPTQSGLAFPKYYLWASVFGADGIVTSGALRVAAIKRENFHVTHFVTREQILSSPEALSKVFPSPLVDQILARAGERATP